MDPFGQTRFGVLALGGVAASLILWLSISFWLDAWNQRQAARQFRQTAHMEAELLAVTRDAAHERQVSVRQMARLPTRNDGIGQVDRPVELAVLRSARLDEVLRSVVEALDDPVLVSGFRFSSSALEATLGALESTRAGLDAQRASNERLFAAPAGGHTHLLKDLARERAMRRTYARTTRLIERLHELHDGLHLEARISARSISDLRRLRIDLRDFAEHASRVSVLRSVAASPMVERLRGSENRWTINNAEENLRLGTAIERLRHHQSDANVSARLLARLSELVDLADIGDPGRDAVMRALAEVDQQIARGIAMRIDEIEAHAHRRLFIDSLLVLVCFWIGIACIKLLRTIQHHAWHDRVTGLVNRHRFEQLLCDARSDALSLDKPLAVLVLGIDNFTSINSRVGHAIGDSLLRSVAERLTHGMDDEQPLGALGGDHFAVVVRRADSLDEVLRRAETLRKTCGEPYRAEGANLQITLSLGVARCDRSSAGRLPCAPARELLLQAEVAMRQAKDDGRDRVRLFDRALAERNRENIELESALRLAIVDDQLELHYQPKVCMRTGRVDGAEALLRWHHPERGTISPGVFVPIAERSGLIPAIGRWVLERAIRQTAMWNRDRVSPMQIAVNISAQQFMEGGLVEHIERLLDEYDLQARHLELEITESVGMIDMQRVVDQLGRLRASGISIAIDDFGTDYSSLQYLDILPLDTLKIDRAFILQLDGNEGRAKGRSLARTIVMLADSLALKTVAEGVETREQLDKVQALGCDYVQGYYYSRPLPALELADAVAAIESVAVPALRPAA